MKNENILVVLSAGQGLRFGEKIPKQYSIINGKKVIEIVLDEMIKTKEADHIVLVVDSLDMFKSQDKYAGIDVICGGINRAESFNLALEYAILKFPGAKRIVYHEAARPLVKIKDIDWYFELLNDYDYVETCAYITDSLGSFVIKAPRREDYYLIQAPEGYRIEVLKDYYNYQSDVYFAANQFPESCVGFQNFEMKNNLKLTTPSDKRLIEILLKEKDAD